MDLWQQIGERPLDAGGAPDEDARIPEVRPGRQELNRSWELRFLDESLDAMDREAPDLTQLLGRVHVAKLRGRKGRPNTEREQVRQRLRAGERGLERVSEGLVVLDEGVRVQ